MLPWHSLFQWAGTKESPPCKSALLFKKNYSTISFSESCDARAETVRPIETYKITLFSVFLMSLTRRRTHKRPFERRLYRFSYTGQRGRNWQKLKFRLGPVMAWRNVKPMTKAATRKYREQVVIAASPGLSTQTWNQPRRFRFQR